MEGPVAVLRPRARLSVETFGQLKRAVHELTSAGTRLVVLDLGEVDYVDSIGIAEIVRTHVMLERRDGALALAHVAPTVAHLLDMTRLDTVLDVHPDAAGAIRHLTGARPGSPA